MKIKKFQAGTEKEAIQMVKNELGKEALIINIRSVQPKGILRFIQKHKVEVTAAIDDPTTYTQTNKMDTTMKQASNIQNNIWTTERKVDYNEAPKVQDIIQDKKKEIVLKEDKEDKEETKNLTFVKLIYKQLINNEVDEEFANQLISEIENAVNKEDSMDNILGSLYQKIILKLGDVKTISLSPGKTKIIFFIGPTGVGKTTTIAKIASNYKINQNAKVAFITADTYRIAAVEQLRTFANILNIPMSVIYAVEELAHAISAYKDYDLIFVDTAGRSHKNDAQVENINQLISSVDEKEVYLVLSATTKYKDMVRITDKYKDIADYKIIFTKLDETSALGNILNIKMLTGADLSYVTYGQNVPKDLEELNSQHIAKHILGGGDE